MQLSHLPQKEVKYQSKGSRCHQNKRYLRKCECSHNSSRAVHFCIFMSIKHIPFSLKHRQHSVLRTNAHEDDGHKNRINSTVHIRLVHWNALRNKN